VASERGRAQTGIVILSYAGVVRRETMDPIFITELQKFHPNRMSLERATIEGESPVVERIETSARVLEYHGTREILWESGGTTPQG
jgi:hypothetical protein